MLQPRHFHTRTTTHTRAGWIQTAASEKRKYKHEHEKSSMPTRNKQRGSGKHDYRDFVAAKMRQNGGNMKAAVTT